MELHRDHKRFKEWNTEATASIIQKKFPESVVIVIKPSKMHLRTFAVYSNFVESNDFGAPTYSSDFGALKHLSCLYDSVLTEMHQKYSLNHLKDTSIYLIGFSKGCVVLNQIISELPQFDKDSNLTPFLHRIKKFYWLDGGHSGKEVTWIIDETPLRHLAALDADINIHITPYQVRDPLRMWIGEQEHKFYRKLKKLNAKVTETEHFGAEPGSIENHFKVLLDF